MHESRQPSSPSSPTFPGAGAVARMVAPPPALCGFLLLLVLMFAVSYAVGAGAGPVAPGMHGTAPSRAGDGGSGGAADDMGDIHGGGH
ncbi:hypothetical protein AB0D11_22925 [Streptomyces monashensis]|uniref:hypothetical protein n=1 Tax=Streptomyces monashensis TaxID=1678012 RepID=UPI0033E8336E